ncbi:hypothetical protein [Bacillus sp. Marseille-P3661]|uniref:hypothetical protein n=1 Tax=Bacillus sp. Marseille-P3661 TaxID=1936234 RepID=UPI002155A7E2|nr:hypothetical protein [Bacillus sp. Marseille-P3661]
MLGKKREYGKEQPYAMGPLKLRLPFIHYKFEYPDFIQGALLCIIPMSGATIMEQVLGIPFEISVLMLAITNFLFLLHTHFGDPVVAGWVTAGIPVYITFLNGFPEGEARIQALIALQCTLAFIFLFMAIFKGADAFVKRVPLSLKAGILLGAGLGAIIGEFSTGGRVWSMPISMLVAVGLAFFMMFSKTAEPLRKKYTTFRFIAQFGIGLPFVISFVLGILIGEVAVPDIKWYFIPSSIGEIVSSYSIFAVGIPPFEYFLRALPVAFSAYLIAFGDILVIESLLSNADKVRKDEKLIFSPTRNSFILFIRNFIQSIFSPHFGLGGPMVGGGQAIVTSRYINNPREHLDSYWGSAACFHWGMSSALLIGPIVTLFQPGLAIGMTLNLVIQGFLCAYLAIAMLKQGDDVQKGVAAIIAAVLVTQGAAVALGIGIGLWLILERVWIKDKVVETVSEEEDITEKIG